VAKGFVIFRDPGNNNTEGWLGTFGAEQEIVFGIEKKFLIQPWSRATPRQVLSVETETADRDEMRRWANEWVLQEALVETETEFQDFSNLISFIRTGIAQGDFEKIVASRSKLVSWNSNSLFQSFENACQEYPNAFVSLINHPELGCWLGATPERFVYGNGEHMETVALAGTLLNTDTNWTPKEEAEQQATTRFVQVTLEKHGAQNIQKEPVVVTAQGPLQHLSEKYSFRLGANKLGGFMQEFHPTPAVGGFPQEDALLFIDRFENLERELFTGWIGWSDGQVLSSWVNLRCARLYANKARLFAGCGINHASDPQKEWLETEAKMQIIGRFLGAGNH
jgi:isochorismate synthase